jgi:Heat induced stress protein YflT
MSKEIAVGTFSSYEKAEFALSDLKDNGFSMNHVSLLAHDDDNNHKFIYSKTGVSLTNISVSEGLISTAPGSLMSGLVGLGLSLNRAQLYRDRCFQGDYLVILEASELDITLVESIFRNQGIRGWYVYTLAEALVDRINISIAPTHL